MKQEKYSAIQYKYKDSDIPAEYNEGVIETLSKALPHLSRKIMEMDRVARSNIPKLFGGIIIVDKDVVVGTIDYKRGLIIRAYLCSEFTDTKTGELFGKMNRSILSDRVDFKNNKTKKPKEG